MTQPRPITERPVKMANTLPTELSPLQTAALRVATEETVPSFTYGGTRVPARVLRVVDGDTVIVAIYVGVAAPALCAYRCRLVGINTPERHPHRVKPDAIREALGPDATEAEITAAVGKATDERNAIIAAANAATAALSAYLGGDGLVELTLDGFGNFGRPLVTLARPGAEKSANAMLLEAGHAAPYRR